MSAYSIALFLHPPPPSPPLLPKLCLPFKSLKYTHIVCFSSSSTSNHDPEESRWLREEQRWLREEQRWLREEQRWARDRDSLLGQISDLKLKIEALEERRGGPAEVSVSDSDAVANIAGLLQLLKDKNRIPETGSSSRAMDLDHHHHLHQQIQEVPEVKEVIAISEEKTKKRRNALRKGLEGEEVRAMQEALLKLGFYSGEEDMEFSSFTSGTERAVKTWQASLNFPQDGIMTPDLLERLYMEPQTEGADDERTSTPKEDANGAAVTSVTEISAVQQTVVKKEADTQVEVSHPRVFLLGENRWEDSSRLIKNQNKGGGGKSIDTPRCIACLGVGRLLCSECDGTGDFNIEEQFLDWVEEGAKCPYCEGHGFTVCDVCEGKK